jgi:hypothetical protein
MLNLHTFARRISLSIVAAIAVGFMAAPAAVAAVSFDASSHVNAYYPAGDTISWSHTVGSGSNRILIVGVSLRRSGSSEIVSNVKFGSQSLTYKGRGESTDPSKKYVAELWYLIAPSPGTAQIKVTFSGAVNSTVGGACSFTGVDQSTPLGTFASAGGSGSENPLVTVSSAAGELVIDVLSIKGKNNNAITADPGQTKRWSDSTGNDANDHTMGGGSTKGGATSVTMSWTVVSQEQWSMAAVSMKPAIELPVQLATFGGRALSRGNVLLEWSTVSEVNNYGFYVQRRMEEEQEFIEIPNSFAPGHGTTLEPQHYSFTDAGATEGVRFYRLRQVDLDGSIHYSDPIRLDVLTGVTEHQMPTEFALEQNFPNPFNPTTVIRYSLPTTARVSLKIYTLLGEEVMTLVDEHQDAGVKAVTLNASGLPSGVYLYRLDAGDLRSTKRLVLLK